MFWTREASCDNCRSSSLSSLRGNPGQRWSVVNGSRSPRCYRPGRWRGEASGGLPWSPNLFRFSKFSLDRSCWILLVYLVWPFRSSDAIGFDRWWSDGRWYGHWYGHWYGRCHMLPALEKIRKEMKRKSWNTHSTHSSEGHHPNQCRIAEPSKSDARNAPWTNDEPTSNCRTLTSALKQGANDSWCLADA